MLPPDSAAARPGCNLNLQPKEPKEPNVSNASNFAELYGISGVESGRACLACRSRVGHRAYLGLDCVLYMDMDMGTWLFVLCTICLPSEHAFG